MRLKVLLALVLCSAGVAHAAPRDWIELKRKQTGPVVEAYADTVKAAQFLLRAHGLAIAADGVYGLQTENALKRFQRKNGLSATGALNAATWEALVISLRPGARGDAVRAMQTLLNGFAEKPVTVDGVYGAVTKTALLKFQKEAQLKADGIVGKVTWSNLSPGQWEGC
ncbi:MAG TPA: peptidoglycan-binding protein [Abditibacteriaceae bacterium]|jgi:peptidoglycan hydrolase-like protein with peptidoglycan-binding domain